jgi:esterase/lipase
MPRLARLVPIFAAVLLIACGGDDEDSADSGPDTGATASPAVEASPQPTAAEDKPTTEPAPAGVTDEPVRFETSDGVTISGHLYSSNGPKRKAVVLAHEFPTDQTAWTAFAEELAANGIDALTFDFRGYGETGGEKDITKIDLDVEAAARFVGSRDYPEVYLFGASMGGTASIKVAARFEVAGLVTISSPDEFMGLDAREDITAVTAPKLFVAAQGDNGAPDAVEFFMQAALEPKSNVIYEGSEHGTEILGGASGAELEEALFAFLEAN